MQSPYDCFLSFNIFAKLLQFPLRTQNVFVDGYFSLSKKIFVKP